MVIINVRHNGNNRWKRKGEKNKDRKKERSGTSYSESVRAKWFCFAFKLGFAQLICKASLIFKSNLVLPLSIILKERELNESKHVVVECSKQNQLKDTSNVYYFKLPYISNISHHIKNKLSKLCKEFCNENFNIKLVFTSFKN